MPASLHAATNTLFDTDFCGRIIQVTEALDPGDAVSNQIVNMNRMFQRMGLESLILSKHHHPDVGGLRQDLDSVQVTEKDIIIFHFCGLTEYAGPWALQQYCTRVMFYHNITPYHFFPEDSELHKYCRMGRDQLKEIVPQFHVHWGASSYNLEELRAAGADPVKSVVIPIIVPDAPRAPINVGPRKEGHWLFVGRIVSNKGQLELIDLFAAARQANPAMAQKLVLVGRYDPADTYYKAVIARIIELRLKEQIELTSKISDSERERYFATSQFYISISEHEGFGVPLVEAPLRGLPVLALDRAAAAETSGGHGLYADWPALIAAMKTLSTDREAYARLADQQLTNAARFSEADIEVIVHRALSAILPPKNHYKTVSVVICTYNRIDHLKRCLDYLRFQSNPNFEVIVVDGPSNDGTKEFLAAYDGSIKIFENSARNLSVSRNIGIENSAGDIVAFIDDDAIPFDTWVDALLRAYNGRPLTVAALGGPVFFAGTLRFQSEDIGIDVRARSRDWIQPHELGKDGLYRANLGTNSTFVRAMVVKHGGFDEQFDYFLDESELCLRLQLKGHLVGYSHDVLVRHEFAQSHNRTSNYVYDWKTICKNIAYFVAAYSGLKDKELRAYLEQRLTAERVNPLEAAEKNGELSAAACAKGIASIWAGLEQGLADMAFWPRTRKIMPAKLPFRPFPLQADYRAAGRDLPSVHICIVSREFPPFTASGGIGTLYYHLASELLLMGHRVTLILPGDRDEYVRQGPFTRYYARPRNPGAFGLGPIVDKNIDWSVTAMARLAEVHREIPVDIIDTALWDTEALTLSMLKSDARPPLVVRLVTPFQVAADINEWDVPADAAAMLVASEKTLINNADAVVPISRTIAKTIESGHGLIPDERWLVAPCGIAYWPLFDVRQNYAELDRIGDFDRASMTDDKIVLFIGRLEPRKGIDLICDAMAAILNGDKHARIVIAGSDNEGWEQHAYDMLPRALTSRVHFLGSVTDALRDKLLAHAHCLLFPSRYESFGLVPLEAFVHGVPVIASRSGAIPEVVLDDDCGLLFAEDDSADLAMKVLRLLGDDALRKRLSDGAYRRVRELSARNSAIRAVEIYAGLMPKPKAKAKLGRVKISQ